MQTPFSRFLAVAFIVLAGGTSAALRFSDADHQVFDSYRQKIKRIRKGATLEDARLQIGFPYIRLVTKPFNGRSVEVWSYPTDEFTYSQVAFLDGKLQTVMKTPAAGAIFVRSGNGLSADEFLRVKRFDDVAYGSKAAAVIQLLGEPKERYDGMHPIPESVIRQFQPDASPEDIAGFAKYMSQNGMAIWSFQVADVSLTVTLENDAVTSVTEQIVPTEEQARLMRAQ